MIDEDKTLELFGYISNELSKGSGKLIVRICDKCNKKDIINFNNYNNKCKNPNLCKSCTCTKENHPNWQGGKIILICQQCNNEYKVIKARENTSKFCSKKCKNKWFAKNQIGKNNSNWKDGLTKHKYCKLFNESFKKLIRDQYHNKCFLCNKSKIEEGRNLSVHHVNYNKSCLCGSTCEFIPLCMSCHIKTNYNHQYWEDLIMNYLYPNRYFMADF